jgi:hypothetical protein
VAHDLDKVLADVLTHFRFDRPREIRVCWGPAVEMFHSGRECSALVRWDPACEGAIFIALSEKLRRAPRYVLAYLIFHECLHIDLPPRNGVLDPTRWQFHHRAFRVAERIWPTYTKSNEWLLDFWSK